MAWAPPPTSCARLRARSCPRAAFTRARISRHVVASREASKTVRWGTTRVSSSQPRCRTEPPPIATLGAAPGTTACAAAGSCAATMSQSACGRRRGRRGERWTARRPRQQIFRGLAGYPASEMHGTAGSSKRPARHCGRPEFLGPPLGRVPATRHTRARGLLLRWSRRPWTAPDARLTGSATAPVLVVAAAGRAPLVACVVTAMMRHAARGHSTSEPRGCSCFGHEVRR